MPYEPVIGLEVHAHLATASKIFSSASTKFGAPPNTQVSAICAGLPGVLPVLNRTAVEFAIKMGLATNCRIAPHSLFARKHYFYPDLPKGYQISQYEEPLCENGWLEIELEEGGMKRIGIIRIHLEEDAGKSIHAEAFVGPDESLIDLNRCGTPLIEIVTAPDVSSPREAGIFLSQVRQLVRYLGICDGNMEEGSLRCDANVSIRPVGQKEFGTKTELKNMNSFRHVERAIESEIQRQIGILEEGSVVEQATLLWDATNNQTVLMRSKEYAHDYRYFPEPDLAPLRVDQEWLGRIRGALPELPLARRNRLVEQYRLSRNHADILAEEKAVADYFEAVAANVKDAKLAANWVMGEVMRALREQKIEITAFKVTPVSLAELLQMQEKGEISANSARQIFDEMLATGESARDIVAKKGLQQVSDRSELESKVSEVLEGFPTEIERYRSGEARLLGFFVGQVMKKTGGKANPQVVNEILKQKLAGGSGQ